MTDHKVYEKILDTLLVLRDTAENFRIRSAQDIKKLIAAKMKAVRREPKDLEQLYALEAMITDLRKTLIIAKQEYISHSATQPHPPTNTTESPDSERKNQSHL